MLAFATSKRIIAITVATILVSLVLISSLDDHYSFRHGIEHITKPHRTKPHSNPPHGTEEPYGNGNKPYGDEPYGNEPYVTELHGTEPHSNEPYVTDLHGTEPHSTEQHSTAETQQPDVSNNPDGIASHVVSSEHGNAQNTGKHPDGREKLAYVTFLSGTLDQVEDLETDNYFLATRILLWQLLHVPETRAIGIDVIVMVTPSVSQSRRDRLKKDGAIVYPVDFLTSSWAKPEHHRWNDLLAKLRIWEMTQYSRLLLMDGDVMLVRNLDGVFNDPAAQVQPTKQLESHTNLKGIAPLPPNYLLASLSEVWDSTHSFPPTNTTGLKKYGMFNAGFFIMSPSLDAFEHYRSYLEIKDSFDPQYFEQNLLNQVHDWAGPMPWQELSYTWNIRCPNDNDFEQGLVSVHEKWWEQPFIYENAKTKEWLHSRRWVMKGFYDAYDRIGNDEMR